MTGTGTGTVTEAGTGSTTRPTSGSTTGALLRVVRSGVGRRRVQTVVIALATMMAVASAVVAGALMVAADAPFDRAFARQHGPHLIAEFAPDRADAGRLTATGRATGVTADAGPFPVTTVSLEDDEKGTLPPMSLAGRSGPHADVDDLDLSSGRWAREPDEIVLSAAFEGPAFLQLGATLRASDASELTVVGFAVSAGRTADGWTVPARIATLASADAPVTHQMLYRFDAAATGADIATARRTLAAAVPAGALLGTQSWLDTKRAADQGAAPTVPFLLAFGVLGIAMSVIVVGSVVSGAVGTDLRRIGVLKAIGCTPREVVRAYVAQALVPASAGIVLGVVLGDLLAVPLLSDTERVYGAASLAVVWWVDVVVPAGALLAVALAALLPALRAGRLSTVEAIAVGRAPRGGRGRWAHRAAGRLPLPRAVTYGLATPFAHPARTLAMLLAVALGTVATTFAVGLTQSLTAVSAAQTPGSDAPVTVFTGAPGGDRTPVGLDSGPAADPAEIRAAIEARPDTASYYGSGDYQVTVGGITRSVRASLYEGDSRAGAYALISGHWLTGPGQAVVPSRFLERTGTRLGDTVRVTYERHTAELRIVGESFDTSGEGTHLHASLADFPAALPQVYRVQPDEGVSAVTYAERLRAAVQPLGGDATAYGSSGQDNLVALLNAMAVLLSLLLASVAGLGVLDSVVLDTRERVHDLGVCKALGMSPRQTVSLVLAPVAVIGVLGGLVGVPVGHVLHGFVVPKMGEAVGTGLPSSVLDVYDVGELALLVLAGTTLAVLGALAPATWAARTRTATVLRAE